MTLHARPPVRWAARERFAEPFLVHLWTRNDHGIAVSACGLHSSDLIDEEETGDPDWLPLTPDDDRICPTCLPALVKWHEEMEGA